MTEKNKKMCHNIADYYGEKHQMLKAIEEMAELTQAIIKYIDDPAEWDQVCDELADVTIMIEQLNHLVSRWVEPPMHGVMSDVEFRIEMKTLRQMRRMKP
jgi:NTP pyrophosphatase (non-canonical NTP hydrolase)